LYYDCVLPDKKCLRYYGVGFDRLILDWRIKGFNRRFLVYFNMCKKVIPSNGIVLDVGSNIGRNALFYGLHVSEGKVYAFEPFKETFNTLQKNIKVNGFKNIFCFNIGLSNKLESLPMGKPSPDQHSRYKTAYPEPGLVSIYASKYEGNLAKFTTLDNFIESININQQIHYLKIDVEGHELCVLQGAKETIVQHKPLIEMEINSVTMKISGTKVEDIFSLLKELDYKAFYNTAYSTKPDNKNETFKELNIDLLYDGTFRYGDDIPFSFDAFFIHKKSIIL